MDEFTTPYTVRKHIPNGVTPYSVIPWDFNSQDYKTPENKKYHPMELDTPQTKNSIILLPAWDSTAFFEMIECIASKIQPDYMDEKYGDDPGSFVVRYMRENRIDSIPIETIFKEYNSSIVPMEHRNLSIRMFSRIIKDIDILEVKYPTVFLKSIDKTKIKESLGNFFFNPTEENHKNLLGYLTTFQDPLGASDQKIGSGAFGQVYLTDKHTILKNTITSEYDSSQEIIGESLLTILLYCVYENYLRNLYILPNPFLDVYKLSKYRDEVNLEIEKVQIDLTRYISDNEFFDQNEFIDIILMICYHLYNLQSQLGFVHGDFHTGNIMLNRVNNPELVLLTIGTYQKKYITRSWDIKFIDFGMSKANLNHCTDCPPKVRDISYCVKNGIYPCIPGLPSHSNGFNRSQDLRILFGTLVKNDKVGFLFEEIAQHFEDDYISKNRIKKKNIFAHSLYNDLENDEPKISEYIDLFFFPENIFDMTSLKQEKINNIVNFEPNPTLESLK